MPHTADVIVEAWGSTVAECLAEAAAGLIGICLDGSGAQAVGRRTVAIGPASRRSMLVELLDEIIFILDTDDLVPVSAVAQEEADGGIELTLGMAQRVDVIPTGAAPKAISRSELSFEETTDRVSCRFLVDV